MNDFSNPQQEQAYRMMLAEQQQGRGGPMPGQQVPTQAAPSGLSQGANALAQGLNLYAQKQGQANAKLQQQDPLGAMIKRNNSWNTPAAQPVMPPPSYGPQGNFNAA